MALKRPTPQPPAVALPSSTVAAVTAAAATDDEIITLPIRKRPRIALPRAEDAPLPFNPDGVLAGATDLRNRLAAFLPALKAADAQLEEDKLAGRIAERRIEIDDSEDEDDSTSASASSDSDSDGEEDQDGGEGGDEGGDERHPSAEGMAEALISNLLGGESAGGNRSSRGRRTAKAPYIEMNLGLGVLEELRPSSDSGPGGEEELHERRELVNKILELRRLQEQRDSEDSDTEMDRLALPETAARKVVLEELE